MAFKLASLAVALCVLAAVFAAPSPKSVVNADDNDVAVAKSVVDANAGAGSSVIEPLPPNNGHPGRKPTNFYNDIFNIPTSILNAVSRLLTGGGSHVSSVSLGSGAGSGGIGASAGIGGIGASASVGGFGGPGPQAATRSGVDEAGIALTGNANKQGTQAGGGFISDIFNIPISALNAVNQLLNNNHKNSGK